MVESSSAKPEPEAPELEDRGTIAPGFAGVEVDWAKYWVAGWGCMGVFAPRPEETFVESTNLRVSSACMYLCSEKQR